MIETVEAKHFKDWLRKVSSYRELAEFLKQLGNQELDLYGKTNAMAAFGFSQAYNLDKTEYLYENGRKGRCYIKNLYKVMEVR